MDTQTSYRNILSYYSEITKAFKSSLPDGNVPLNLIRRFPPIAAGTKLNTDGRWYESNGKAGYGGLFREHMGKWLLDYHGKPSCSSCLETEIYGIYRGLTIILEKGLCNVCTDTDSLTGVELINEDYPACHPQQALIMDSKMLLTCTQTSLVHILRQANQSADHMARLGAEQTEEFVITEDSPQSVCHFELKDGIGISILGISSLIALL